MKFGLNSLEYLKRKCIQESKFNSFQIGPVYEAECCTYTSSLSVPSNSNPLQSRLAEKLLLILQWTMIFFVKHLDYVADISFGESTLEK